MVENGILIKAYMLSDQISIYFNFNKDDIPVAFSHVGKYVKEKYQVVFLEVTFHILSFLLMCWHTAYQHIIKNILSKSTTCKALLLLFLKHQN